MSDFTIARSKAQELQNAGNQQQARYWIESVLSEELPAGDLADVLHDGIYLCRVMHALSPQQDMKVITATPNRLRMLENIGSFLQACRNVRVPEADIFAPMDLFEQQNILKVFRTLRKLAEVFEGHCPPWEVDHLRGQFAKTKITDIGDLQTKQSGIYDKPVNIKFSDKPGTASGAAPSLGTKGSGRASGTGSGSGLGAGAGAAGAGGAGSGGSRDPRAGRTDTNVPKGPAASAGVAAGSLSGTGSGSGQVSGSARGATASPGTGVGSGTGSGRGSSGSGISSGASGTAGTRQGPDKVSARNQGDATRRVQLPSESHEQDLDFEERGGNGGSGGSTRSSRAGSDSERGSQSSQSSTSSRNSSSGNQARLSEMFDSKNGAGSGSGSGYTGGSGGNASSISDGYNREGEGNRKLVENEPGGSGADVAYAGPVKYVPPPRRGLFSNEDEMEAPEPKQHAPSIVPTRGEEPVVNLVKKLEALLKSRDDGASVLHLAVQNNMKEVVDYVLSHGGDPNVSDKDGKTPIHIAAAEGNIDMVTKLIGAGGDINKATSDDITPLQLATERGKHKVMGYMTGTLKARVDTIRRHDGWSPLYTASYQGNIESVQILLKHKANPNVKNNEGWTALHAACHQGHTTITKELVGAKAYLNTQSNQGTTPLFHAVEGGWMNIIKFLVERGADIERGSEDGWRPLHMAVYKGYNDVADYLVSKEAQLNEKVTDEHLKGYTPLHIVVSTERLSDDSKKNLELLLKTGADIYEFDNTGATALHLAAYWNNVDAVEIFLNYYEIDDVVYDMKDINNQNAAEVAAYYGNHKVAKMLSYSGKVQQHKRKIGVMRAPDAPPSPGTAKPF